jgi:hypothetical protein
MSDDLVKRLRHGTAGDKERHAAADRIEKLEAAMREILSFGEWGANPLARTVILEALESKCEQLEEGA